MKNYSFSHTSLTSWPVRFAVDVRMEACWYWQAVGSRRYIGIFVIRRTFFFHRPFILLLWGLPASIHNLRGVSTQMMRRMFPKKKCTFHILIFYAKIDKEGCDIHVLIKRASCSDRYSGAISRIRDINSTILLFLNVAPFSNPTVSSTDNPQLDDVFSHAPFRLAYECCGESILIESATFSFSCEK